MSRRAAFLDRDGTLNRRPRPHEYVRSIEEFVWLPGAVEGACRLAAAGFVLVMVSNQRGVSRGLVSRSVLQAIEDVIQLELADHGCEIASFRYCFHDKAEHCECRKPKPGLLLAAARDLDLELSASWMIGDSETDVQAGRAAGCHTGLVNPAPRDTSADVCGQTLDDVSRLVLAQAATA